MHPNSLNTMSRLLVDHVPAERRARCDVYDVGSYDHNGSYRKTVTHLGFRDYKGLDIAPGPNVDIVVPEGAAWSLPPREVVISGQCLEHTRFFWQWFDDVANLATKDGIIIIIAPWVWPEHRYPIDCWRILPDGMRVLADWACVELVEAGRTEAQGLEGDAWGVFRRRSHV